MGLLKGRAQRRAVGCCLPSTGIAPHPWRRAQAGKVRSGRGAGGYRVQIRASPHRGCLRTRRKDCCHVGALAVQAVAGKSTKLKAGGLLL